MTTFNERFDERFKGQTQFSQAILGALEYRGINDCGKYLDDDVSRVAIPFIKDFTLSEAHELLREMEEVKWKLPEKPCLNAESRMFGQCFNCMETNGRNAGLSAAQEIIRKRFGITD